MAQRTVAIKKYSMSDISTVLDYFNGNWKFTREMHSFDGVLLSTAQGDAKFKYTHLDNELTYHENGEAVYNPSQDTHEFFRDYVYSLSNDQMQIYHASGPQSGQLYQAYKINTPEKLIAVQTHICGDDTYEGLYELIDDTHFTLTTKILGPKKDVIITTYFSRSTL